MTAKQYPQEVVSAIGEITAAQNLFPSKAQTSIPCGKQIPVLFSQEQNAQLNAAMDAMGVIDSYADEHSDAVDDLRRMLDLPDWRK